MQALSVFMMSWNLSWAYSYSIGVIDGFCRIVVSSRGYRLVAS
jgi:hypothetical protein